MIDVFNYLIVFFLTVLGVSTLGLVAGFSPVLYIAQITMGTKAKRLKLYTGWLIAGVLAAILLLIALFQTLHLDTLVTIIDTTVHAITVSVIFNIFVGLAFIYGGFWYLRHQEVSKPKSPKLRKTGGSLTVLGLGFVRTFTSISGITATYIAGNAIANVSVSLIERLLFTALFLVATIIPFIAIVILMRKEPHKLMRAITYIRKQMTRLNYRPVVGVGAVIFGSSITIINIMMFLFY